MLWRVIWAVLVMVGRSLQEQKSSSWELLFDPTPPSYAYGVSGLDVPFAFRA